MMCNIRLLCKEICVGGLGGDPGNGTIYEDSFGWEEALHVDGGKGGKEADGSGRGESCGGKRQRLIRKKKMSPDLQRKEEKGG